jgi:hypothetical protein
MPGDTREAGKAERVLRQHGDRNRIIHDVGRDRRYLRQSEPFKVALGQITEVVTPVEYPRKPATAGIDRHLDRSSA